MSWTPAAATALVAWFVFVFWQPSRMSKTFRAEYELKARTIFAAPPGWLFGVAWLVLYGLMTAAAFLYFGPTQGYESSQYFVAAYVLFVANVLLNKLWSVLFFDARRVGWALVVAVLLLLSAVAVAVLFGLTQAWAPFGLYVAYPLWLCVALYLNAQWMRAPMVKTVRGDGRLLSEYPGETKSLFGRLRNE